MDANLEEANRRPRSTAALLTLALCAVLVFSGLVALGTWQIERLSWKRALIERIEQRVHAAPASPPGPERWSHITADSDEYRYVQLRGTYLYDRTTKVQASTELGSGYWLLTPLRATDGTVVLVNRGFVPANAIDPNGNQSQTRESTVTGLLRMSEPRGDVLRNNDPANGRWYSRDVQAIAAARGLAGVAPYFIDADAAVVADEKLASPSASRAPAYPVGGLTVVRFPNNHLVYSLTWYALALMVAFAAFWVAREERRLRHDTHRAAQSDSSKREM